MNTDGKTVYRGEKLWRKTGKNRVLKPPPFSRYTDNKFCPSPKTRDDGGIKTSYRRRSFLFFFRNILYTKEKKKYIAINSREHRWPVVWYITDREFIYCPGFIAILRSHRPGPIVFIRIKQNYNRNMSIRTHYYRSTYTFLLLWTPELLCTILPGAR